MLSDEQRKYDPTIFPFYRSHTQGQVVSEAGLSDVNPLIKKFRSYTYAVWVFAIAFAAWAFWPNDEYNIMGVKKNPESKPVPKAQQATVILEDGLEPIPITLNAKPAASALNRSHHSLNQHQSQKRKQSIHWKASSFT